MNVFSENEDNLATKKLVLQHVPYYDSNCLNMANESYCIKFISLPCIQNLLTDIWMGVTNLNSDDDYEDNSNDSDDDDDDDAYIQIQDEKVTF